MTSSFTKEESTALARVAAVMLAGEEIAVDPSFRYATEALLARDTPEQESLLAELNRLLLEMQSSMTNPFALRILKPKPGDAEGAVWLVRCPAHARAGVLDGIPADTQMYCIARNLLVRFEK